MLKSYLKLAWRSLLRNKLSAFINIFGLSLAIGSAIVIFTFIEFSLNKDSYHEHADEIYMVESVIDRNGNDAIWGITPAPLGLALKEDFPQLKRVIRIEEDAAVVRFGDKAFDQGVDFVDPEYLEMFTFPLVKGEKTALSNPNMVVLSDQAATRFFGDEDAMGKSMSFTFNDTLQLEFIVGGIAEEFNERASFSFNMLLPIETVQRIYPQNADKWNNWYSATFVQTDNPQELSSIASQMDRYLAVQNEARKDFPIQKFLFDNVQDLTERSGELRMSVSGGQDPSAFYILGMIGIFLIALACFNYINIAIASATRRLKEIGIRKVVGGSRAQLIFQFLSENLLICFLALLVGIALAEFLLNPGFNYAINDGDYLSIAYDHGYALWAYLIGLLLFTGFAAGAYPALYVSSFQAVSIFRKTIKLGGKRVFTKILLTVQFVLAFFLMTAGIAFTQNVAYQADKDWGYNQEQVMVIPIEGTSQFLAMRDALSQQAGVQNLSGSKGHIGGLRYIDGITNRGRDYEVSRFDVGPNYLDVMGIRLNTGRFFDKNLKAEATQSIMVNEKFVKEAGWEDPLSEKITIDTITYQVIGVVEDFHYDDFFDPIDPTILLFEPEEVNYRYLVARISKGQNSQTFEFAEKYWKESVSLTPFEGFFQDSSFDGFFRVSRGIGNIFLVVAIMAILLACMGLFGLVSLNVASRTKEFSVRKVLGASLGSLGSLLNREFSWLIILSLVIGIPSSYFLIQVILDSVFAFHLGVHALPLVLSSLVLAFTLVGTISSHMFKLAAVNPADALRDE